LGIDLHNRAKGRLSEFFRGPAEQAPQREIDLSWRDADAGADHDQRRDEIIGEPIKSCNKKSGLFGISGG
jgi:hypothetical protein